MRPILAIPALLFLICITARADTLYTYTGNDMNGYSLGNIPPPIAPPLAPDCHCALTGTFALNTVLTDLNNTAISWSFTDGTHTLDQTNSIADFDASGIGNVGWFLTVTSPTVQFLSQYYGSQTETTDSVLVNGLLWAIAESNHGTLTGPVATPEPGTLALLAVGLVGLLGRRRSKSGISSA